jgi:hypothetical protein
VASGAGCRDGVEVTVPIEPGARYTWSGIEWVGASAISAADLDRSLGVAPGQSADIDRLTKSLVALAVTYHRRGYLAARLLPDGTVDEARRTVACRIKVVEGPRFRFSGLELIGLEADLASRIRQRWTLAAGEFYDGAYARQFITDLRETDRAALAGRTDITIRERPDSATLSVDLVLEFARPAHSRATSGFTVLEIKSMSRAGSIGFKRKVAPIRSASATSTESSKPLVTMTTGGGSSEPACTTSCRPLYSPRRTSATTTSGLTNGMSRRASAKLSTGMTLKPAAWT